MFYTIYKITNTINNKFYIGAHRTYNIDDDYMGSGLAIKRAIQKYGLENFNKEILFVFNTEQEMYDKELEIVNEDFINRPDVYNLKLGGPIGYTGLYDKLEYRQGQSERRKQFNLANPEYVTQKLATLNNYRDKALSVYANRYNTDLEFKRTVLERLKHNCIKAASPESNQKRKDTMKRKGHSQGEKNSQFGMMWIYNLSTLDNKKIPKDSVIPDGWVKGRKV